MLSSIWHFLSDPANRTVLSWLGGGVVVACSGIFALVKFRATNAKRPVHPSIAANEGSFVNMGDIARSTIEIHSSRKPPQ